MDDDQDGGIEVEESVEFIIEDMQQQQQINKHSHLHREDQHITVEELWRGWKSSEVHNWTQEDVLRWLREFVELPQYERSFKELRVNGNTLPRIASNEPSFMSAYLKIQDQQHKQKLKLKALDVVLFGPLTRPPHNWMKDLLLIVSVVMGVGGCWFAQVQNKASKVHISKMMKDLESLQRAELSLRELQEQLERAQEEKRTVTVEKQNLEEKMRDEIQGAQEEANRLHQLRQGAVSELSRLRYAEEELEQVRGALKKAEMDMQTSWTVPDALQLWLQLTHEVEVQYYNVKKHSAEQQLGIAKDEAEKIKKKRSSVLGTLQVAHGSSLDQIDHKILAAKNALGEVTACLRERLHRWQQIERLCGFPVMNNPGLPSLTANLYSDTNWLMMSRVSYSVPAGEAELEEDLPPMMAQIPGVLAPIKRSPRAMVRPRRTGHIVQPPVMLPPDPDLIPIRAPLTCYGDDEDEHIHYIAQLTKPEYLETSSDTDSMGSSVGRIFTGSALDTPSRRLLRDDVDMFSDSTSWKVPKEEQEDSNPKRSSREELDESLKMGPWKVLRDDHGVMTETPKRKTSREELDLASVDLQTRVGVKEEPESVTEFTTRKIGWEKLDTSMDASIWKKAEEKADSSEDTHVGMIPRGHQEDVSDSQKGKVLRERKEIVGDTGFRKTSREELDVGVDPPRGKMFSERKDPCIDVSSRKSSRDELDNYSDSHFGKIFKEPEISFEAASRKPPRDDSDVLSAQRRRTFRDKRDFSLDAATTRKISRDEFDFATESQRRRTFRDFRIDNSIDTPTGKIPWDRVDFLVDPRRISREEHVAMDVGRFGQPDITVSSLKMWKPPPDPLSMLVYDGILEKAYPASMATPGTTDFPSPLHELPQGMVGMESAANMTPHRSPNASPPESRSGSREKTRKSSKFKSLFQKKKKDTRSSSPDGTVGSLQRM
ncbi:stromal interaction molecule 2 [Alosa pseudoharengus]|uniref:stromal interaction molecule 2 n=1 Tax=Alosa pseudoharengus TaxID=34774 RepID=UPI003F8B8E97